MNILYRNDKIIKKFSDEKILLLSLKMALNGSV